MHLLSNYSGMPVKELPTEATRIASVLGGLPLALAVCAAMVSEDHLWRDVLDAVTRADLSTIETALPNYIHAGFHRAQQASLDTLEREFPAIRSRYEELAIFEGSRDLDEEAIQTLWAETAGLDAWQSKRLLAVLAQRLLLTLERSTGPRPVTLHDMQWLYLRWRLPDSHQIHQFLLANYQRRGGEGWLRHIADGYLDRNIGMHLAASGREPELVQLLLDPGWIERRIARDDISGLLTDYTRLHSDISVKRIGETIRLSAHVLVDRPGQLVSQLIARLDDDDDAVIRSFLENVRERLPRPKLEPRFSSLARAGSEVVSMMRHRAFYGASAIAGDKQGTIWTVGTLNGSVSAFDARTGNLLWEAPGTEHRVNDISISDAERIVIVLFGDGSMRVYTIEDGKEAKFYPSGNKAWDTSSLSSNGLFGLRGRKSGVLERVDLRNGAVKPLPTIKGLKKIAISGSGSHVAVAHAGHKITVFDAETGVRHEATLPVARTRWSAREVGGDGQWSEPFEGNPIPVSALAVADSGSQVVCAQDKKVVILSPVDNVLRSELIGHTNPVTQVHFLGGDSLVATVSIDRTQIWTTSSGKPITSAAQVPGSGVIGADIDGRWIGASAEDVVRLWDVERLIAHKEVRAHRHGVSAIAISGDGKKAVTGSWDMSLALWDLEKAAKVTHLVGHTDEVVRVAIDEDGGKTVSGSVNGEVILWNFDEGESRLVYKHDDEVTAVRITPSGNRLVSVSMSYDITSMDLVTKQGFHSVAHFDDITDVVLSRDGRTAVTASFDDRLIRWDLLEECTDGKIDLGNGAVVRVMFMPGDKFVLAATSSRLFLVALPAMQIKWKTKIQKSTIKAIALAPAGDFVVTGHESGEVRIINLNDRSEIKLPPHSKPLKAVAVTADGKSVVSASEDGTIRITAIKEAAIAAEFVGDSGMNAMALSSQADLIVAGERSGNVHILTLRPS